MHTRSFRRIALFAAALTMTVAGVSIMNCNEGDTRGVAQAQPEKTRAAAGDQAKGQHIVIQLNDGVDDLHGLFMAMTLARALQDGGAKVTIFANLEGVRVFDKRQPNNLRWGAETETLGDLYDAVVAAGATVVLCPHCAAFAGITKNELRPGARIATQAEVDATFLRADKVLTY